MISLLLLWFVSSKQEQRQKTVDCSSLFWKLRFKWRHRWQNSCWVGSSNGKRPSIWCKEYFTNRKGPVRTKKACLFGLSSKLFLLNFTPQHNCRPRGSESHSTTVQPSTNTALKGTTFLEAATFPLALLLLSYYQRLFQVTGWDLSPSPALQSFSPGTCWTQQARQTAWVTGYGNPTASGKVNISARLLPMYKNKRLFGKWHSQT